MQMKRIKEHFQCDILHVVKYKAILPLKSFFGQFRITRK